MTEKLKPKRLLEALEQFETLVQRYPVDLWLLSRNADADEECLSPVVAVREFIAHAVNFDAGPDAKYEDLEYILRADCSNWRFGEQMKHHLVPEPSGIAWCKLLKDKAGRPSDKAFCNWLDDRRLHGSARLPENYIGQDGDSDDFWGDPDFVISLYAAQELRTRLTKLVDPKEEENQ